MENKKYLIFQFFKNKKNVLRIFIGLGIWYYIILLRDLKWFSPPLTLELLVKRFIWGCFLCSGFIFSTIAYFKKYKKIRLVTFLFSSLIMVLSSFFYSFTILPASFLAINGILFYLFFIKKGQDAKSIFT